MFIEGKYMLVYIQDGDSFIATACDKTCTLHIEQDFIPITNPSGGRNKRRLPTDVDWSLTGNGLVDFNRKISAIYMQQNILLGTRIHIRIYTSHPDGYALKEGYGYFQSVDEIGDVQGVVSYSYIIVGDSDLSVVTTIPQDADENELISVLMNSDNELITDSDNNIIIVP